MNEFEKMTKGLLYNAADKDLNVIHMKGMCLCQKLNAIPKSKTKKIEKTFAKLIPSSRNNNFIVFTPFYCEYGINIHLGKDCYCNYNCTFLDISPITLGNSVWLGSGVTLATPMHPFLADERINHQYEDGYHDYEYSKPITIKDNVWVCASATICGGVTIGENSIIGAGSVVTRDIPPNVLAAGNPCKVIRELSEKDRLNVLETYKAEIVPNSKLK